MAINLNGESKRIGLALSGGGFRAAAFHLGVFRKLDQLGLLEKVDLLTCVSGGSIAGGFLAANWGTADVLDRLEEYLSRRSIAVSTVLGGIFDPFHSRTDKLASSYDKYLFDEMTLDRLESGPRIYFNATNMATGNMFFFVAGGGKPAEMGDWELGVKDASGFPISRAVAASSAFPPVFPPLKLDDEQYPVDSVEYVTLTDGGVYDNLGVNPLVRERNDLDYAIVSDGGKPFAIDTDPTESGTMVLKGAIDILMEQVRGLQFKRLELNHRATGRAKPLWFSIDSKEGMGDEKDTRRDAAFASSIGTNLTALDEDEMEVLVRHGGNLLESRMRLYAPELVSL